MKLEKHQTKLSTCTSSGFSLHWGLRASWTEMMSSTVLSSLFCSSCIRSSWISLPAQYTRPLCVKGLVKGGFLRVVFLGGRGGGGRIFSVFWFALLWGLFSGLFLLFFYLLLVCFHFSWLLNVPVSQGQIYCDHSMCCHTETEVTDQTCYPTQSQHTDTSPTSPSTEPITPGTRQGSHNRASFDVSGKTWPGKARTELVSQSRPRMQVAQEAAVKATRDLDCGHGCILLLVRQMEIPVSPMKVAVHRRSLRLPYSLRATGVWSGQIPFLSGS